eukprot:TRINITY_DN32226_c0_g1_i1.p1 TRINITY_DN32226_c0_g1~~TRINITY_DN32226_c0_g1_i1.p1  ORF type:complete len:1150 (-),score=208.44 TRINITY_DN32226_c0_g1_i1:46-3456(-)
MAALAFLLAILAAAIAHDLTASQDVRMPSCDVPAAGCSQRSRRAAVVMLQTHKIKARMSTEGGQGPEQDVDEYKPIVNDVGNCLQATNADHNGARLSMEVCDGNTDQTWRHDAETGLVRHAGGRCLDASQRNVKEGVVHVWECDSSLENQIWDWNHTGHLKNRYGICLDAPIPTMIHSHVHMWLCEDHLPNQRWSFENEKAPSTTHLPVTPSTSSTTSEDSVGTTLEATSTAPAGDTTSTTTSNTASMTTTTTTEKPLSAIRNCQLEPLVEGVGCTLLKSFHGSEFGLNEFSQETSGREKCLQMLRSTEGGDAFVHSVGRCEIWSCVTSSRLRMSAGVGGGLSDLPNAVALKTSTGLYITADDDGAMHASENTFVAEAMFELSRLENGKVALTARNGKFVKALPPAQGSLLRAESEHRLGWEEFDVVDLGEGKISLRTAHDLFVTATSDSFLRADSAMTSMQTELTLVNRSKSAFQTVTPRGPFAVTMAGDPSYGDIKPDCHDTSWTAAVRCCADDHHLVGSMSYGCHTGKTFSEAQEICESHNLTLCTREEIEACRTCGTGCGFDAQRIWTLDTCDGLAEKAKQHPPTVYSSLCLYQPGLGGLHGQEARSPVFVKLFEWNYDDIAKECVEYLSPNGIDAVQVAPVTEHVVGPEWWTKYQPASMGLDTRSGTEAQFKAMVATCRAAGVQVIVDILMNHIARPCEEAKQLTAESIEVPCTAWGGSRFGNRRAEGARTWDKMTPDMFHHKQENDSEAICNVGPQTGWLCPHDDCTPCDMYELPDFASELKAVQQLHFKHVEELYRIGVTMLRVDAAIYHHVNELSEMLNRLPWDLIYQEWWGEFPPQDRTDYVGIYRDVAYRWKLVNALAGKNASDFPDLLTLNGGVFGINEDMAVYPFAYHDGRSALADPEIPTYKNGLAYHQQQKFFLAWPLGHSVLIWGGYGYRNLGQGPPGCERGDDKCTPDSVYDEDGQVQCMQTPTVSPMPRVQSRERTWICEHRWQGVAGMVQFRKACRAQSLTATWEGGRTKGVELGHVAFRLGGDSSAGRACFVALVQDDRGVRDSDGKAGMENWNLKGLHIGLPAGRYCDVASLETHKGWNRTSCPREVTVAKNGEVLEGSVLHGDLLAIYTDAVLVD